VQPRLIFALGVTATCSCLDIMGKSPSTNVKLRNYVGRCICCTTPWGSCRVVPLWHPSPQNPRSLQRENTRFVEELRDKLF
jgi:uracil-DNA glycosylase